MTYKAVFTDEFLSHFRLDDNGKTLVLTDKTGLTRAVMLEEVKHGEWIDGYCSECGCDIPAYIEDWHWKKYMNAKYCPNCGAYMRKRREAEE